MTQDEVAKLEPGIYRVWWENEGACYVGAVGRGTDGRAWFVAAEAASPGIVRCWGDIARVELITTQAMEQDKLKGVYVTEIEAGTTEVGPGCEWKPKAGEPECFLRRPATGACVGASLGSVVGAWRGVDVPTRQVHEVVEKMTLGVETDLVFGGIVRTAVEKCQCKSLLNGHEAGCPLAKS